LLFRLSEYAKAKEELEASLAIFEANHDATNVDLAPTLGNLGNVLRELGEYAEAKEIQERELPSTRRTTVGMT
jgi:tetratricopeptide (TPR) repeat protein